MSEDRNIAPGTGGEQQPKTQEIANERDAINNQRTQYIQSLQQLMALAVPELKQFENIDCQKLGTENPAEAVRLQTLQQAVQKAKRKELVERREAMLREAKL